MSFWNWLKKLPIGRWIGQLLKPLAVRVIESEGDKLQAQVIALVERRAVAEVGGVVDRWQIGLCKAVDSLPAPVRPMARNLIQNEGDRLQGKLEAAVAAGDHVAVNVACDAIQAALIERVKWL